MKILCLYVRHGTTHYPDALTVLDQWYERHGLMEERTLWIIDNALPAGRPAERLGPRTILRAGDNRSWEFSAWTLALREAREQGETWDLVHFVTSAFNTLYTEYLRHFHRDMLRYTLTKGVCLGHIDGCPQPVRIENENSQSWIRTCFFFLPWSAAFRVEPWVAFADPARVFTAPASRQFRPDSPLSSDYRTQITAWLEGREIGGHTWHSPVREGAQENVRFQLKTLAILNEHCLAITLRRAGIRLVDFCWLHSLPEPAATDPLPELEQLKTRRRILGIPE